MPAACSSDAGGANCRAIALSHHGLLSAFPLLPLSSPSPGDWLHTQLHVRCCLAQAFGPMGKSIITQLLPTIITNLLASKPCKGLLAPSRRWRGSLGHLLELSEKKKKSPPTSSLVSDCLWPALQLTERVSAARMGRGRVTALVCSSTRCQGSAAS